MNVPLFEIGGMQAIALTPANEPELQHFFEANPSYFLAVHGGPPAADAAHEELRSELPAGWPYTRQWHVGFVDESGSLLGMAGLVSDLLAERVWHIGLFIVATPLHGGGTASALYRALEAWMQAQGAQWLRLGVVAGNRRAERFWARNGYRELRVRDGVAMGQRVNRVRVMAKSLGAETLTRYLTLVVRDRPDAP